jgi:hypothetical protein
VGKHRRIQAAPSRPSATTARAGTRAALHHPIGRRVGGVPISTRTAVKGGQGSSPSPGPLVPGAPWLLLGATAPISSSQNGMSNACPVLWTFRTYGRRLESAATPLPPACCVDIGKRCEAGDVCGTTWIGLCASLEISDEPRAAHTYESSQSFLPGGRQHLSSHPSPQDPCLRRRSPMMRRKAPPKWDSNREAFSLWCSR